MSGGPRGTRLKEGEKAVIIYLESNGVIRTAIAKTIKRSRTVVDNFLRDPEGYGTNNWGCPRRKISDTGVRLLVRTGRSGNYSCAQLKTELGLTIGVRQISRILRETGGLRHKKKAHTPLLTGAHKKSRISVAKEWKGRIPE
jgi:transposase